MSSPPRFVLLLRGVNVGKGNRVPMGELKLLLEGLSCTDVVTILNSGNAVFTGSGRSAAAHAAAIAEALQRTIGVTTPVVVKSAVDFHAIVAASPGAPPESDHSRYLVAFAQEEETILALEPLEALAEARERFTVRREAAYLHCPLGLLQSKVAEALLGKAGKRVTTRNWATVLKLAQRVGPHAA